MANLSSRGDYSEMKHPFKVRTLLALVICTFLLQASHLCGQAPASRIHAGAADWVLGHQAEAVSVIRQAQAFNTSPTSGVTPLTMAESVKITDTITTFAGSASPGLPIDGTSAITQSLGGPSAVVPDGNGGFYLASYAQNQVYRVTAAGTLFVIAGTGTAGFSGDGGKATSAQLDAPLGLAVDAFGNLYIADWDNGRIRKVTPAGVITTVAGNGAYNYSGDGGPATSAGMGPTDVSVDASGNLLIVDMDNDRVRKVSVAGIISTVAGTLTGFSGDGGPATSARLDGPARLAVDVSGNLFIADYNNGRIRKVDAAGMISTVAGNGAYEYSGDGGPATSAGMGPLGVAVDTAGTLFVVDVDNQRIRRVTTSGVVSTVAGTGVKGFSGDGGAATQATLSDPSYIDVDTAGNIYIADSSNNRIRKVMAAGVITTSAGNGTAANRNAGFSGDGGPAISALLAEPMGVAVDASGNVFIADYDNGRIRKISTSGVITTVAGKGSYEASGDGGPATSAGMGPIGVAVDAAGNLYIADADNHRIRKVNVAGVVSTVAGTGALGFAGDGGPAISAQLNGVSGVAVDAAGNLYIADSGNHRVRKVTADGIISTVAGTGTSGFSGNGGPATSAQLSYPLGVTLDASGNLYIPCAGGGVVRKVTAAGIISTVAGNGALGFSGDGGPATSAQLRLPVGVAIDGAGNLYISDLIDARIRKVSTAGVISTLAGTGKFGFSGDGGPAASASLAAPAGLAVDGAGNLYVGDSENNRVRRIAFSQQGDFAIVDRGGAISVSTGAAPALNVGYAAIRPNAGSAAPAGLAIFGFRQNNILVSEAGVPATPAVRAGRIYAEVNGPVNTGLAIANPNNQPVTITFYFTNSSGDSGQGVTTIPANSQIAKFLDQAPFNAPAAFSGTFTFSSASPVAVIALRGFTNERGEFLITTLPVADLTTPATGEIVFPHFADGGGWTTQIVLVNPGDSVLIGTVQFFDQQGAAATVSVNGQSNTSYVYSISPRSSQKWQMAGTGLSVTSGSVRVDPAAGTRTPSGLIVFSYRNGGITVAEAGVPAITTGNAFRLYAEVSGRIQTGIAVANTSSDAVTVTVEANRLDGSSTGLTGTLTIPGNGQTAVFLNQVPGFGGLPTPFQGVLRLSSSAPIAVTGLRGHYNERDDFLITTTPPINEVTPPSTSPLYFPHIVDSGGYTTQFILFSVQPGSSASGGIQFVSQAGGALNITLR